MLTKGRQKEAVPILLPVIISSGKNCSQTLKYEKFPIILQVKDVLHRMGKRMEKELRKRQSLLVDTGMGMVMFGIWSVVKINMYLALSSVFSEALQITTQALEPDEPYFIMGFWIIIAVFLVGNLSLHLYIGLSAVADGKGRKKGYAYILLTAALLASNLQTNWYVYRTGLRQITINSFMGIFLDMASLYVIVELLITAIRVKRLRKKMKR